MSNITFQKHIFLIVILSLSFSLDKLQADESSIYPYNSSPNDHGGIGLIQAPTARFSPDGTLVWGASNASPYNRLFVTMQFLPFIQATVKYTETNNRLYSSSPDFSGNQSAKDKGADIKIKLFNEGEYMPQIAIGLRDIGGTSKFSSEYIVATKMVNNFDITFGFGYGNMGTQQNIRNPLSLISNSFDNRPYVTGGAFGGSLNQNLWFKGERISLFGGVQYKTKIPNLSIKVEYDPNSYQFEPIGNNQEVDSPINIGLSYILLDKFYVSANYERGNLLSFNLSKPMNFSKQFGIKKFVPPKENLFARSNKSLSEYSTTEDRKVLIDTIITQMGNEGLAVHSITFVDDEVIIEISQKRFRPTIYAIDLASRIMAYNAPTNIKYITVNNLDFGITNFSSTIERQNLINLVATGPLNERDILINSYKLSSTDAIKFDNPYIYPNYAWSLTPTIRSVMGGPDDFFLWQAQLKFKTVISFKKGLYLETEIHRKLKDNFSKWKLNPTSGTLHHVRSDIRKYWQGGDTTLARMQLDYLFRLSDSLVGRFSAGILEEMFGGIGGEILFLPEGKPWAIGIDSYVIKQREYDQKLSFRDYKTTTGHLTFFYELPFYNLLFKTSYGKYLAQDKGYTIDLSRRYNNGVEIGARVALTDATAYEYGEGSFGKWIYGSIPMDIVSRNTTRDKTFLEWAPLTRDGGVKLKTGKDLYVMMKNPTVELSASNKTENHWTLKKVFSGFHLGKNSK